MPARVCLITPGHAASTPRLVKNADALAEAGYDVRVVCGRHFPPADPLDAAIFARARWRHRTVDFASGPAAFVRKLLRRACRRLAALPGFGTVPVASRVHHAEGPHLAAVAAAEPADLYLGHCLAGLPAAAAAARRRGVPYGFDEEDFHDAETEEAAADPAESRARRLLQSRLLPGCAHLTAGSPLIAEQMRLVYGAAALPLLNVFPLSEAPPEPVAPPPIGAERPARIYWFSQNIGPKRGLEDMVSVLARLRTPAELHLRGFGGEDYRRFLREHAAREGLARPIVFLPPGPPAEMARLAAPADLGLSVEDAGVLNRDLCLGNKIFAYLLAGIPQLLSPTSAQKAFAGELGEAALVADLRRPDEAAAALDRFLGDAAGMARARRTAWELARRRFCWDVERKAFLESVRRALGARA